MTLPVIGVLEPVEAGMGLTAAILSACIFVTDRDPITYQGNPATMTSAEPGLGGSGNRCCERPISLGTSRL